MNKAQNKYLFFFGAGADSCYDILKGEAFRSIIFSSNYKKERKELLGEEFSNYNLIHCNNRNVFLQTIEENKEKANSIFGKEIVDMCSDYYNGRQKDEKVTELCKNWYKKLQQPNNPEAKFFLENAVFFDSIDEKFNSLRNPQLNSKAKRVVNTYTMIYIAMIKELYGALGDFKWTYQNIIDLLQNDYNVNLDNDSYYKKLKEITQKRKINFELVTTNYTEIAEKVIGKKATYLHGNLKWFEDYENLTIYDCDIPNERKCIVENSKIFPFILIPSGVKPIICRKELEMFAKFMSDLNNCKTLFVVGYRFNSEDNHINSLIAEWLRNPENKMIYFNFNNECVFDKFSWYKKDEFKNIDNVFINEKNGVKIFEEYVNKYCV